MARSCTSATRARMSRPGTSGPRPRATRLIWRRSEVSASAEPGYCTLTATSRPSAQVPRWTCPIDAAAAGSGSNQARWSFQPAPSSRVRISRTVIVGIGGAESWSRVSCSRYGACDLVGQRRLEDRHRLAELHRPALELAQGAEQLLGGALLHLGQHRLGRGAADALAEPRAVRPAYPRGSAASLAVRATALRGSSLIGFPSAAPGQGAVIPHRARRTGVRGPGTSTLGVPGPVLLAPAGGLGVEEQGP